MRRTVVALPLGRRPRLRRRTHCVALIHGRVGRHCARRDARHAFARPIRVRLARVDQSVQSSKVALYYVLSYFVCSGERPSCCAQASCRSYGMAWHVMCIMRGCRLGSARTGVDTCGDANLRTFELSKPPWNAQDRTGCFVLRTVLRTAYQLTAHRGTATRVLVKPINCRHADPILHHKGYPPPRRCTCYKSRLFTTSKVASSLSSTDNSTLLTSARTSVTRMPCR